MIALVSLFGVSGCVGSFDDKVAKDRYISLIKQDPMFNWRPPGNLTREVHYVPLSDAPLANRWSVVTVVFSGSDAASTPGLVKLAQSTSLSNGYDEAGKRKAGDINISLSIQVEPGDQSFSLYFKAPVS
jgi:hypothetical protein